MFAFYKEYDGYFFFCALLAAGLFLLLLSRPVWAAADSAAYPTASKADVEAKLRAKGKSPWIEREKGMGVVTLKSGGTLSEDFFPLDAYEAYSTVDLRDSMPKFASGYKNQKDKTDDISRALEAWLKKNLPMSFRSLAGEGRVDVVRLAEHGNVKAYVFIIPMGAELAAVSPDGRHFYYKLPTVLRTLENFLAKEPALANIIWLERAQNFFMFVVQHKK
ncbi:hypothetical protein [uncultured Desulfovibrio sp.]|uniref:hypothetical protein n=1 Tax=uncultured Desulfovibrio sp. TaxID=167968 RepID=UPI0026379209|nr:hypothetical protein [uncultured Desulfovibrio sp.]